MTGKTDVEYRRCGTGRHRHRRVFRFFWKLRAHRVGFGQYIRQRRIRIGVEFHVDRDLRSTQNRLRCHVVDIVRLSNRLFQRLGNKALNQVGTRTVVAGADGDHRIGHFRIFTDLHFEHGLQTKQGDQKADRNREYRTFNKNISKAHTSSAYSIGVSAGGVVASLSTMRTFAPLLKRT